MNFMPGELSGDTVKLPLGDVRLPEEARARTGDRERHGDRRHPAGELRGRLAGRRRRARARDRPSRRRSTWSSRWARSSTPTSRSRACRSSPTSSHELAEDSGAARGPERQRRSRSSPGSTADKQGQARRGGRAVARHHEAALLRPLRTDTTSPPSRTSALAPTVPAPRLGASTTPGSVSDRSMLRRNFDAGTDGDHRVAGRTDQRRQGVASQLQGMRLQLLQRGFRG